MVYLRREFHVLLDCSDGKEMSKKCACTRRIVVLAYYLVACVADALNLLCIASANGLYKWFRRVRGPAATQANYLASPLEAKLVSSKHLSRSVENMASYLSTKYTCIYLNYKLSILFCTKIIYAYHKHDCSSQKLKL